MQFPHQMCIGTATNHANDLVTFHIIQADYFLYFDYCPEFEIYILYDCLP